MSLQTLSDKRTILTLLLIGIISLSGSVFSQGLDKILSMEKFTVTFSLICNIIMKIVL